LPQHERLTLSIVSLVENILKENSVEYLSVTGRVKTFDSANEKIARKGYSDPKMQLMDLSGIRVITFLESQVDAVTSAVRTLFEVDEKNSLDRSAVLGSDRIGYRSAHFVCSLGKRRNALPEYHSLSDLKFEIQVRTVLQHAWAELAHDRSFKFGPGLPTHIQRKLNLYSGMLEVVDGAFDAIAKEIDAYRASLQGKTIQQIADFEISTLSLEKFAASICRRYDVKLFPTPVDESIVEEIKHFGISTVGQLEALTSEKYGDAYKANIKWDTPPGLLRTLMMYDDLEKYLAGPARWKRIEQDTTNVLLTKYSREQLTDLLRKHAIALHV
jgi:ppGpp synthetase/RelA/SpoT-type nucleotidyltranferase